MTYQDYAIQGIGWIGMLFVLWGFHKKSRTARQAIMATGALLLTVMAALPPVHPVFLSLHVAIFIVGYMNMKDGRERAMAVIVTIGAIIGSAFALLESIGVSTWIGIVGLTGIALGYSSKSEEHGGYQFLWLGIGSFGMVLYSAIGVWNGVWQACPFLALNIPLTALGLKRSVELRELRRRTT